MDFNRPEELMQFHRDAVSSASMTRLQQSRICAQTQCYYQGLQWWQNNISTSLYRSGTGTGRLWTDWNPDSNKLRATINRTAQHIQKAAAATFPEQIYVDVHQSEADPGIDASFNARVFEQTANCAIDYSAMLDTSRAAQFNRVISGTWGFLFYISNEIRYVDGQEIPDKRIRSAPFDPVRLVLDPADTSRNLLDHEYVIYEDAWTLERVERVLGIKIPDSDRDKYKTIGALMANELMMNTISQNMLYNQYRQHSTSRGTMVTQVHVRDASGRFGRMYVCVQDAKGEYRPVNFDNPVSPFGGSGLPLFLLHGHRRPMSMWSIGEGQMLKDDQDRLNLLGSMYYRWIQTSSGPTRWVDRRNFPKATTDEQIRQQMSNRIGGVMIYEARTEKGIPQPHTDNFPAPPQHIMNDMASIEGSMRQQNHRAEGHYGMGLKSHVPDSSFSRALEEQDQVFGIRVKEDAATYAQATELLIGTTIKFVKEQVPGTLIRLRDDGFGEEEFRVLLGSSEYGCGCTVIVRESSIRFRSIQSRQQDLDKAASVQQITPMEARMERAIMDTPITSSDRQMVSELNKAVHELLAGVPWQPLPMGKYTEVALDLLRRALFDKRAKENPRIKQMVLEAIVLQTRAIGEEAALAAPPVAQGGEAGTMGGGEQPQEQTLGDILMQMNQQGGQPGVPAEPAAA